MFCFLYLCNPSTDQKSTLWKWTSIVGFQTLIQINQAKQVWIQPKTILYCRLESEFTFIRKCHATHNDHIHKSLIQSEDCLKSVGLFLQSTSGRAKNSGYFSIPVINTAVNWTVHLRMSWGLLLVLKPPTSCSHSSHCCMSLNTSNHCRPPGPVAMPGRSLELPPCFQMWWKLWCLHFQMPVRILCSLTKLHFICLHTCITACLKKPLKLFWLYGWSICWLHYEHYLNHIKSH